MDTKRLRELAAKATTGPWSTSGDDHYKAWLVIGQMSSHRMYPGDAAYIAAISPDVLIAILDRLEELEESVREYRSNARERGERD